MSTGLTKLCKTKCLIFLDAELPPSNEELPPASEFMLTASEIMNMKITARLVSYLSVQNS